MKKVLSVLALTGFVAVGLASSASALTLPVGEFKMKYSDWEREKPGTGNGNGAIDLVGEVLHGIAVITSFEDLNGHQIWAPGPSPTEEITAVFDGLTASSIGPAPGGYGIFLTGGTLTFYHDTTPDFNPNLATGGATWTDGTVWLTANFVPGIITGDMSTTLRTTVDSLTSPFTGKGSGYLQITGGSAAGLFEKNVHGPGLDLFLQSDIAAPSLGKTGWPASSEDPILGTAVPEPATMTLLGMGLMGTGFFSRKRRK